MTGDGSGGRKPKGAAADLERVRRCVQGDAQTAREIFREVLPQIRQVLYRVVGPDPEHEDLVQQAMLQLFRSFSTFRGEAALTTWVDRVCANVARQHIRNRSRKKDPVPMGDELEDRPDPGPGPMATAERSTLVHRLYYLLDRLDEKQRVALVLHEVNGLSVSEVAEATGANVSTAKSRIWFGRKKLLELARRDAVMKEYMLLHATDDKKN